MLASRACVNVQLILRATFVQFRQVDAESKFYGCNADYGCGECFALMCDCKPQRFSIQDHANASRRRTRPCRPLQKLVRARVYLMLCVRVAA